MAIRQLTEILDIISALHDEPNEENGLSAAALKAKFDEGGNIIKNYLNEQLIPDVTAEIFNALETSSVSQGNLPRSGAPGQILVKTGEEDYATAFSNITTLVSAENLAISAETSSILGLASGATLDGALHQLAGYIIRTAVADFSVGSSSATSATVDFGFRPKLCLITVNHTYNGGATVYTGVTTPGLLIAPPLGVAIPCPVTPYYFAKIDFQITVTETGIIVPGVNSISANLSPWTVFALG